MGASHLRPRVPHDRSRRGCARRVPGDVSPRVSCVARIPRAGEVLVLAVPHRAEPVSRLGAARAARRGGAGAGGCRSHGSRGGRRAVGIDRRSRRAQGSLARGREGDGAAGRAAHRDRAEGVPRLDVPGNRRLDRLPVEYGEDAVVPGTHGVAARARQERFGPKRTRPPEIKTMTDMRCGYAGDRDETLIAYLYDDIDPAARGVFDAHLAGCEHCRAELEALGGVRTTLARWNPPEPKSLAAANPQSATRNPQWWRTIPAWAQVAAALLFLGVSAGIANLDVRYDRDGLAIRTGWSKPAAQSAQRPAATEQIGVASQSGGGQGFSPASKADLEALERQLRTEVRSLAATPAVAVPRPPATGAGNL